MSPSTSVAERLDDTEKRRAVRIGSVGCAGRPTVDKYEYYLANQAAKQLKIDTWNWSRRRIEQKPADSGLWFHLFECCNDQRIDDALSLANKTLDLAVIGSGPGHDLGLGPGFEQHQCLDVILQSLTGYPGKGIEFVRTGLRSSVIRNRNMALRVLSEWGRPAWPTDMETHLQSAIAIEPEPDVRQRMENLAAGRHLDAATPSQPID